MIGKDEDNGLFNPSSDVSVKLHTDNVGSPSKPYVLDRSKTAFLDFTLTTTGAIVYGVIAFIMTWLTWGLMYELSGTPLMFWTIMAVYFGIAFGIQLICKIVSKYNM